MENRSHALAAGVFVLLLGIAAVLAVWFFGGRRDLSETYILETRRNVTGLNLQAQVRYRGIRAGKVTTIEPDVNDPRVILVTVNLDARYRLTRSTTAQLGYQGITGLAYVQIEDDGTSRDYLDTTGAPPRIALKPTLLDSLGDKAGDIVAQVAELSKRLNALLDDKNAKHFAQTLENVAAGSEGLKQVPQLVAAMRETLSEANLKRLGAILAHAEKGASEAAPLAAEARAMVAAMTALSAKLDRFVDNGGGQVTQATLPQFNLLLKELTANSRQLTRLLDTLADDPQAPLFGKEAPKPGPGESGFVSPASKEN